MPSGAKKRKAAKKKKELEANSSTNISLGNDDGKSQDDKGSDSGVDSPASQNHETQKNPFSKGDEEIQESQSSLAGVHGDLVPTQKVGLETRGVIESQRDWKSEDSYEGKNGSIQNESVYKDNHRSISSDDESQNSKKKSEVLAGETNNLSVPTASVVYSITPEVSASEEAISVAESASIENTAIPDMIVSEKLATRLPAMDGVTSVPVAALVPSIQEHKVSYLEGETIKGSSGALESVAKKGEQKTSLPDVVVTETRNFAPHISNSESQKYSKSESEDQPLIPSRPPVAQRTPWWSCCGLCDVLTGSNR